MEISRHKAPATLITTAQAHSFGPGGISRQGLDTKPRRNRINLFIPILAMRLTRAKNAGEDKIRKMGCLYRLIDLV